MALLFSLCVIIAVLTLHCPTSECLSLQPSCKNGQFFGQCSVYRHHNRRLPDEEEAVIISALAEKSVSFASNRLRSFALLLRTASDTFGGVTGFVFMLIGGVSNLLSIGSNKVSRSINVQHAITSRFSQDELSTVFLQATRALFGQLFHYFSNLFQIVSETCVLTAESVEVVTHRYGGLIERSVELVIVLLQSANQLLLTLLHPPPQSSPFLSPEDPKGDWENISLPLPEMNSKDEIIPNEWTLSCGSGLLHPMQSTHCSANRLLQNPTLLLDPVEERQLSSDAAILNRSSLVQLVCRREGSARMGTTFPLTCFVGTNETSSKPSEPIPTQSSTTYTLVENSTETLGSSMNFFESLPEDTLHATIGVLKQFLWALHDWLWFPQRVYLFQNMSLSQVIILGVVLIGSFGCVAVVASTARVDHVYLRFLYLLLTTLVCVVVLVTTTSVLIDQIAHRAEIGSINALLTRQQSLHHIQPTELHQAIMNYATSNKSNFEFIGSVIASHWLNEFIAAIWTVPDISDMQPNSIELDRMKKGINSGFGNYLSKSVEEYVQSELSRSDSGFTRVQLKYLTFGSIAPQFHSILLYSVSLGNCSWHHHVGKHTVTNEEFSDHSDDFLSDNTTRVDVRAKAILVLLQLKRKIANKTSEFGQKIFAKARRKYRSWRKLEPPSDSEGDLVTPTFQPTQELKFHYHFEFLQHVSNWLHGITSSPEESATLDNHQITETSDSDSGLNSCKAVVLETDFNFISKDLEIILTLRQEPNVRSVLPEAVVTINQILLSGRLRWEVELTPEYPFVGNSSISFVGQPTYDYKVSGFGGVDLTVIPGVYSFINHSVSLYIEEITFPRTVRFDLKPFVCPSCFTEDARPTLSENLLVAWRNMQLGVTQAAARFAEWSNSTQRHLKRILFPENDEVD